MNFIAKWWKGTEYPPRMTKINGRHVIVNGSDTTRHWTADTAHAIVYFYIHHWQWLWGIAVAILLAVFFGR